MRSLPFRATLIALVLVAAPALAVSVAAMAPEPSDQPTKVEDADLERAIALVWAEEYAEAEPLLQAALKRNPKDPDAWNYLGFTTRKLGDMNEGMAFYRAALAKNPGNIAARSYMGQALVETGDLVGARHQLLEIAAHGGSGTWSETSLRQAIMTGVTYSY